MTDVARVREALAGRYIIEREIGRGGMATVYLARDLKHGRHVALKLLGAGFLGAQGVERFLREIRLTARLTHPNILPLYDSGEAVGVPYYTMPWIDGDTLRAIIDRDGTLPVDRAVTIASHIADALSHAHAAGIIHRDIKPDNVLVSKDAHVWVADFGLAHALAGAANARLSAGFALGSPHYMSPEQAQGQERAGPESDVYSLGCVMYEMLAGAPPFSGTIASVLSRQITETPKSITVVRPDIPDALAHGLATALEKDPKQRYVSAAEFKNAINGNAVPTTPASKSRALVKPSKPKWLIGSAAVLTLSLAAIASQWQGQFSLFGKAELDDARWAVMSFNASDASIGAEVEHRVYEALANWSGISVADPLQDNAKPNEHIRLAKQAAHARKAGAGRFVSGDVEQVGDTLRVHARLYDSRAGKAPLRVAMARIPKNFVSADSTIALLAESLLLEGLPADVVIQRPNGTRSVTALRAYVAGQAALMDWETTRADSLLSIATRDDPQFAAASLWLAQLRNWTRGAVPQWSALSAQASAGKSKLTHREQFLSDGLEALAKGDFAGACDVYKRMLTEMPRDFPALYGLGECVRLDRLVVPDQGSITGWKYRSSQWQAVQAYKRALQVMPSSHKAFRSRAYSRIRSEMFFTGGSSLHSGLNSQKEVFKSLPLWQGDSLYFIPVKEGSRVRLNTSSSRTAIQEMRSIFHEVTQAWVAAYPSSPAALEADAVALELLGDPRALGRLKQARALATDKDQAVHLAVSEVWLRLKLAMPGNHQELNLLVQMADSLLTHTEPSSRIRSIRLASLAELTGQSSLAAKLIRMNVLPNPTDDPLAVRTSGDALLAFAALGGPVDSIRALERAVDAAIRNTMQPSDWDSARRRWLGRSASIVFPTYVSSFINASDADLDYMVDAELAFTKRDYNRMVTTLKENEILRASAPASTLKFEVLYPEAWMIDQSGDPTGALEWLRPTLDQIEWLEPGTLNDLASAGSLPLTILLYAHLLDRTGDMATARRWRSAVEILWTHADAHSKKLLRTPLPHPGTGTNPRNPPSTG